MEDSQAQNKLWEEYYIYEVVKTLTAGSGTVYRSHVIKTDADADFRMFGTTYVATSDCIKVKLRDDSTGRYLIKDALDIKSIAGRNTLTMGQSSSFLPYLWPYPYRFTGGSTVTMELSDYSTASNSLRLAFHGSKVRNESQPWRNISRALPMIYGFKDGATTISANGTAVVQIEIDIDAHFLVQKITGRRTGDAIVSISEDARGREWSNVATHIDNIVGNGAFPNILPAPRFIQRGSVIIFSLTDMSGASNTIDIVLSGLKMYE